MCVCGASLAGVAKPPPHLRHTLPLPLLWHAYRAHRFVFSPWGNGVDCGRSWEVLLLGAVPVIERFPGAVGYNQGGVG